MDLNETATKLRDKGVFGLAWNTKVVMFTYNGKLVIIDVSQIEGLDRAKSGDQLADQLVFAAERLLRIFERKEPWPPSWGPDPRAE